MVGDAADAVPAAETARWLLPPLGTGMAVAVVMPAGSSWLELKMPGVYETTVVADTEADEGSCGCGWCWLPTTLPLLPPTLIGPELVAFTDTLVMCGGPPGLCSVDWWGWR